MAVQRTHASSDPPGTTEPRPGRAWLRLAKRTLAQAWGSNIFSEAAGAAFWQTLSLPPLLLGLLGLIGFTGDWFGHEIVSAVQQKLIAFAGTVFAGNVVHEIIAPTVGDILTRGHSEIVSVGFIISWWAGSSALASFVDAITAAYGQYGVRHPVWQRIVALLMYLVALVCAVVGLPLLALGPGLLPAVFPAPWQPTVIHLVSIFYYPATAALLVVALTTLYRAALPRKLPWWRGLPGAGLAMVVALVSSIGLRYYIRIVTSTGYTYGALATPIAFLLGAFMIGLAVILGAHFNSAIQEMWPAKPTRRQRRRWRRLSMASVAEKLQIDLLTELTSLQSPTDQADAEQASTEQASTEHASARQADAERPESAEHSSVARTGERTQAGDDGDATEEAHVAEEPAAKPAPGKKAAPTRDTAPAQHSTSAGHPTPARGPESRDEPTAGTGWSAPMPNATAPSGAGKADGDGDPVVPPQSRAPTAGTDGTRNGTPPEPSPGAAEPGQARLPGGRVSPDEDQSSPPGGMAS